MIGVFLAAYWALLRLCGQSAVLVSLARRGISPHFELRVFTWVSCIFSEHSGEFGEPMRLRAKASGPSQQAGVTQGSEGQNRED